MDSGSYHCSLGKVVLATELALQLHACVLCARAFADIHWKNSIQNLRPVYFLLSTKL